MIPVLSFVIEKWSLDSVPFTPLLAIAARGRINSERGQRIDPLHETVLFSFEQSCHEFVGWF